MKKSAFLVAIQTLVKVRISFNSKEDKQVLTRVCAPLDYGPSRRAKDKSDRYHFWDFESDTTNHVLSLKPEQVVSIELLKEHFDPSEFITWDTKVNSWFIPRHWGKYS